MPRKARIGAGSSPNVTSNCDRQGLPELAATLLRELGSLDSAIAYAARRVRMAEIVRNKEAAEEYARAKQDLIDAQ